MPTQRWMDERQLVTFYMTKEEFRQFKLACAEKGLKQAEALRETVRTVLNMKDGEA